MNTIDPNSPQNEKSSSANSPRRSGDSSSQKIPPPSQNESQRQQEWRQAGANFKGQGDFFNYISTHREHTAVYLLLALGLLLVLFTSFLIGGFMIGAIGGYYFSPEIIYYIRNLNQIAGGKDQLRYVIIAALSVALFIEAPGIFIGAVIVAIFKQVIKGT